MNRSDPTMIPVVDVTRGDRVAPAVGWSSTPDRIVTAVTVTARAVTVRFVPVTGMPGYGRYAPDAHVPVRR